VSASAVRIAVGDDSPNRRVLSVFPQDALNGRGLSVLAKTAARWGSQSLGPGKASWADYPCAIRGVA
jgi:hypothetical protein